MWFAEGWLLRSGEAGAAIFFGPDMARLEFERREHEILIEDLVGFWEGGNLRLR